MPPLEHLEAAHVLEVLRLHHLNYSWLFEFVRKPYQLVYRHIMRVFCCLWTLVRHNTLYDLELASRLSCLAA